MKKKHNIILLLFFFSISSCQEKTKKNETIEEKQKIVPKDLNNYLEIKVDDLNIYIGELTSINDNLKEDFNIEKKADTLLITKKFLESDNIDGKSIYIKSKNDYKIGIKYNMGLAFRGNEKENEYLKMHYTIDYPSIVNSSIPAFNEVLKNKKFQNFLLANKKEISQNAYQQFMEYYGNIPVNDLKRCCPSDYQNYLKIKSLSSDKIENLNLEQDLITYLDYETIIITIKDVSRNKDIILKFSNNTVDNEKLTNPGAIDWNGVYNYCISNVRTDSIKSVTCHEISISNDKAIIESNTNTFCNGTYKIYKNENEIELKYNDDDGSCKNSTLKIKSSKNEYFIKDAQKSIEWIKLNKS